MPRTKLGIIFGGRSEEHPISVKSAIAVAKHLDLAKYQPVYIGVTTAGGWLLCDGPAPGWERRGCPAALSPDATTGGLIVFSAVRHRTVLLDVVLPLLHGRFGEDGAVQGLLELAGIPYVGCDIQSSALCMDKSLTYLVAHSVGIATPRHVVVAGEDDVPADGLSYPVFVKPARSGSSFGVSRADCREELRGALRTAAAYDSKLLIEQAVDGSEVGCAVLGSGDELIVGDVDQISLSHGFFRIHQESTPESGSDNSTVTVPAAVPEEQYQRVQATAKKLYRALGCRGLARVDMFLTRDGTVVLNEVNTLPGMTSYSRYPRMMTSAGWSMTDVIDLLVSLALSGTTR